MIWESSYWKDTLLKEAAHLQRRAKQNRWPEASLKLLDIPLGLLINFYEQKLTNDLHRLILPGANR